jgi:hypothetical protein
MKTRFGLPGLWLLLLGGVSVVILTLSNPLDGKLSIRPTDGAERRLAFSLNDRCRIVSASGRLSERCRAG